MNSTRGIPPREARFPWRLVAGAEPLEGELVIADRWDGRYDGPLPLDAAFRLVLLTGGQTAPAAPANPWVLVLGQGQSDAASQVADSTPVYGQLATAQAAVASDAKLQRFWTTSGAFLQAYYYLRHAALPPDESDLALDRTALEAQIRPDFLVEYPERWASIAASFEFFQARYRTLLVEKHQGYAEACRRASALLVDAAAGVAALRRLNGMSELGPPLGDGAVAAWAAARDSILTCTQDPSELGTDLPFCPTCGFSLTTPNPDAQVRDALAGLDSALQSQLRRLSSEAVRRILAQGGRPRLGQFLDLLRASDTASLVQVLDDDTAAFIRALLAEALGQASPANLLEMLREKYAVIEEEQIPEAVREFESLLRQAAAAARTQQPGAPVRLRLE